jgi:hypothetical protein
MNKNWRYPGKLKFTAREGLTGVPVVVQGHFVGTVGPNVQHTIVKVGLGMMWTPLNTVEFYPAFKS